MESLFLTNYSEQTFLDKIKNSLRTCQSFCFSVSFIKRAGLVLLSQDIKAAIERGVKGKLITTIYQNFTDVESLKFFLGLANHPNFECHLDYDCFYDEKTYEKYGFHSKGYLFDYGAESELIIGSSNITRFALLKNIEWDMMLRVSNDDETLLKAKEEFDILWEKTRPLDIDLINKYAQRLNFAIERWDMDYDLASHEIKPNFMQRKALRELNRYRAMGQDKALVVAATGSGKTYLAAFDALNFSPEHLLYIVHEGSILKRSLSTFQTVFGGDVFMGEYTGEHKDLDASFLFSTNVSMCRSLELFDKKQFDYIIIDECHHAAADSYKKIIDYFEPEFLLGLTATPERMDNQDVYELFGNNVPYELRLRDAFKPLGLEQYGVEINIDSLSKEEILNYVENENFYSLKYMKQDYNNFKKYINSPTYPKHMDYLNSDSAPDLLKFMQIKIGNKKTNSYYGFLKGIEEENLVEFNAEQENVINYLSGLLQLVRPHDYLICKFLLEGDSSISLIAEKVKYEVQNYNEVEFSHALKYLAKSHIVIADGDTLSLGCELNNEFNNYLVDLLEYGLTKYKADYANNTGMFLLWNDYRYDQVQIKRCINPGYTAVGTYYGAEGDVYIFASIKKDVAEGMEHLNYKDKFLEPSVFQWECKANISDGELNKLKTSKYTHLFIRKVESENGITLPFTYVGIGHLDNPRQSQNEERKRTFIFDIHMEEELPDYLQYDFRLTN